MKTLLLPILVPAIAGLLALLVPARWRALRAAFGVAGAVAAAATALDLVGHLGAVRAGGITIGPLALDLLLRADGFSNWATAFTALLTLLCAIYSVAWFRGRGGAPGHHYALLLLAQSGAATVLLADQLLLLVIGWEVVTLCLFLLVVTGRPAGSEGAAKAFVMLGLGDLALLVGAVLVGLQQAGPGELLQLDLGALRGRPLATGGAATAAWLLLFAAAAAKAGAMPLHGWIPTMAKGTNPVVMAFLPGSLDKVLGIYLLVRVSLDWFVPAPWLRALVMLVGAVTMLGAVFLAMVQHDLRKLLACHAVSQVGYMLLGIGTGTVVGVLGGVFHMVNHAIYKACLFLGAGSVEREAGTMELGRLGGLARTMPVTFGSMLVAALAISGVPPLNGFASKWLVYQGCAAAGLPLLLVAAVFGSALTLASFVKVLHSVFFGARPPHLDQVAEEPGLGLRLPLVALAVACLVLGVVPGLVLDPCIGPAIGLPAAGAGSAAAALAGAPAASAAVGAPAAVLAYPPGAFAPGTITVLLLLGTLAALFLGHLGNLRWRRTRSVFVGGEAIDRNVHRFPGTEFYRTVQELPRIGPLLEAADRQAFDPFEGSIRVGRPTIALLRRLHGGSATAYVAWCVLGAAALLVVLVFWR